MTLASGADRGRQRHGLWRRAVVDGGSRGVDAGRDGQSAGQRLLRAQAGGKPQADGTIREQDIRLSSNADTVVNGKTVANGLLNIKAGTDLVVGKNGLAQGKCCSFAGQTPASPASAGTAETAATGGGTLRAEVGPRHFRDGHGHGQLAGQSVGAAGERACGRHRHRAERRSDHGKPAAT
ncbi:hypothetical protein WJ970_02670 [Achromobacter xylosoxidans]